MISDTNKISIEIKRMIYRSKPIGKHIESNRHSDSFVFYVKGGHRFDFGDYQFEAHEGEMVYLPYKGKYTNYVLSENTEYYQLNFTPINDNVPYPLFNRARVFDKMISMKCLPLFREVYEVFSVHDSYYNLLCASGILKIIAIILKNEKNNVKSSYGIKKLEIAINHLNEYYYLNTSVEELAKMASTSVSNLEKCFKKHLNSTPINYRHKIRTERAKLLLAGGYSVKETAENVGYSDIYYFSRMFKKLSGTTPGKYSKENKNI